MRDIKDLPAWERLFKKIVWKQLGEIKDKNILDFGSGEGITSDHFAKSNRVVAVEPWEDMLKDAWTDHDYRQVVGDIKALSEFEDNSFDMIICHNVLEYIDDKANALLDGEDSTASKFGAIRYYDDSDVTKWCPELYIEKTYGIRTFWDLQQNQEKHSNEEWQEKMMQLEMKVSRIQEFINIAFFHHLIIRKSEC